MQFDATLLLDVIVVLLVLGRTVLGFRTGFVAGLFGITGVIGGALLGWWAGPQLIELMPVLDTNRLVRSVILILLVGIGIALGEFLLGGLGRRIRGEDRARGADAFFGGVVALVVVCLVVWFALTAVRPVAPSGLAQAIDRSHSYRILDTATPDALNRWPGRAADALASELPKLFGGDEPLLPIPEPDSDSLGTPGVQAAAQSIVQIRTDSPECRSDSAGSGWVVAPERVITNAHVVAGSEAVTVSVGGPAGQALAASVVGYDPVLDLAVLAVPTLTAPALGRAPEQLPAGADAVAAGYPWGGPYTLNQTRVRGVVVENGTSIYGDGVADRQVYAVRGTVRPGNSGGPLLTAEGLVAGTVYAMSALDPQTGYALTDAATGPWLDAAAGLTEAVDTGACMTNA